MHNHSPLILPGLPFPTRESPCWEEEDKEKEEEKEEEMEEVRPPPSHIAHWTAQHPVGEDDIL